LWEGFAVTAKVEELAQEIASLDETEFQALLERVEELSFWQELRALSDRYRKRLAEQGELNEGAEEILKKLKCIREEIAAREYPG
jgi:hypothetical protein